VQFGKHVYVAAPTCHTISNKITRRQMLQDSNIHNHCIIIHYSQTPLNVSECAFKFIALKLNFGNRKAEINLNSKYRLQDIAKYC